MDDRARGNRVERARSGACCYARPRHDEGGFEISPARARARTPRPIARTLQRRRRRRPGARRLVLERIDQLDVARRPAQFGAALVIHDGLVERVARVQPRLVLRQLHSRVGGHLGPERRDGGSSSPTRASMPYRALPSATWGWVSGRAARMEGRRDVSVHRRRRDEQLRRLHRPRVRTRIRPRHRFRRRGRRAERLPSVPAQRPVQLRHGSPHAAPARRGPRRGRRLTARRRQPGYEHLDPIDSREVHRKAVERRRVARWQRLAVHATVPGLSPPDKPQSVPQVARPARSDSGRTPLRLSHPSKGVGSGGRQPAG